MAQGRIKNVTVVGAGNMGSGIAQAFAQNGFKVCLNDISQEGIDAGIARIRDPLGKRIAAGKMKPAVLHAITANLRGVADLAEAVKDADLVIEAVFEDLKVKQDLFTKLDSLAPDAILATNTSSFYVRDVAEVTKTPERVVGLHFFFPAAINKLVEVVRGPATSPEAFDATYEAASRAGKVAIETADAPGFAVNRFFVPFLNEAVRILDEGIANVATIEAAGKGAFQIGMGPFQLMNVTGLAIGFHACETLHSRLGDFYQASPALRVRIEQKLNWDLDGDVDESQMEAIAARLRGVTFGIACHLVDEGIATPLDTDRGATIGLRWANGPFAMMNAMGLEQALAEVKPICEAWGDAFPLPASLEALASEGKTWHLPMVRHELLDEGRVARITFDRPEALNALAPQLLQDLDGALDAIEASGGVRAIVLTGSGKAFIAGADIPAMKAMDRQAAKDYTVMGNRVIDRLAAMPCPVIMAINGFALGGGLELALAGDLLYASDRASLGLPEVGLGLHPGYGGTQRLPRRIGAAAAKELIFTGRILTAQEAVDLGLVNAVVAHDALADHAIAVARTIASHAPLAVAGAKASMDRGAGADLPTALQIEQESVILLFDSHDKDEGLQAFLERRKPVFQGQ